MPRRWIGIASAAFALGPAACKLEVISANDPTRVQVKQTPADLENYLGTLYRRWSNSMYTGQNNVGAMAAVMAFETFSTQGNGCMSGRVGIPRTGNDNSPGNSSKECQRTVYYLASEAGRGAAEVLRRMNEGLTFGSPAQDARNRAFAWFINGLSNGYLALVYDSAAIISPSDPLTPAGSPDPGQLSGYSEVMNFALAALDSVRANAQLATSFTVGANFPLPANWMFTPNQMTAAEFIKVTRSYAARLRAGVARNPAEREAVDWDRVIDDARNGITADHLIVTNSITGPNDGWVFNLTGGGLLSQMTPFILGMADKTGAYGTWIATPLATRGTGPLFFMQTDDQRFPQGATRGSQQADFALTSCSGPSQACKRFFVNRTATDPGATASWGASQYDVARFTSWKTSGAAGSGANGPIPFMTMAEINLLEAEGHIRKGNLAAAAALIDRTRAACGPAGVPAGCSPRPGGSGVAGEPGGGLPRLSGVIASLDTPVPGGTACVPRVPVEARSEGGGTTKCGNILEALKWEKRIETMFTHFGAWFFDSRGWGDLVVDTPVHWAPPYDDLLARGYPESKIYSTGGLNPTGGAGRSGYGW